MRKMEHNRTTEGFSNNFTVPCHMLTLSRAAVVNFCLGWEVNDVFIMFFACNQAHLSNNISKDSLQGFFQDFGRFVKHFDVKNDR